MTDQYFQKAIHHHEPHGNKAPELIQKECAKHGKMYKTYFHNILTGLCAKEKESET
jgi:hypothetical protein